ncbi:MAG: septum formation initiator family protein [Candidatus Hydrogenedentota bacterium]|nr:MAG: septum formation initiator family protein [Candidatus Hydrogenedentota bacterium]
MRAFLNRILKYLLTGLLVAGCVYVLKPGFEKYVEHRNEVQRLEAEIRELEAERVRLEQQMRALEEEDPEYIERLAREKLHLSKPGETVFRFKKNQ